MRAAIRRAVAGPALAALHATGSDGLWVRTRQAQGAVILMYHAVTDAQNRPWVAPEGSIPVEAFAAQMAFLARHRNPVSLSALVDAAGEGRTLPAGTVAVTFDDGYLDTLRLAAPILARHAVPATVFVVSDWVGKTAPWVDLLYSALQNRRKDTLSHEGENVTISGAQALSAAFRRISRDLLMARPERRDAMLAALLDALAPERTPPRLLMDWTEIARWQAMGQGFEVGVHTRTHSAMTVLDDAEIAAEVAHCADALSQRLGIAQPHFAYPYGRADRRTREVLRASPCRSALEGGRPSRVVAGVDPFALTRANAPGPLSRLAVITSGAWPELPRALGLGEV